MINTVITSFTSEGYEAYGRRFLDTFAEHWPKSVSLIVYYEGEDIQRDWVPIWNVEGHDEFMQRLKFPLMKGILGEKYNIQFDARMCRKTLMLCHSLKQYGGKIFWVDADCLTHSDVPETFLDEVLPDNKLSCYLGRHHYDMYTESGFLGINSAHPFADQFQKMLLYCLFSGVVFTLKGWHDCYVFDWVREQCPERYFVNLGEDIPKTPGLHPFVNSVLGTYMDHLKGPRKKTGRSSSRDFVVQRDEPYWRG